MDDRNVWRSRAAALVEASLSRPRLHHSREVARLSSELCDRFHADEEKGYIAGVAHDLARELDGLPRCSSSRSRTVSPSGTGRRPTRCCCTGARPRRSSRSTRGTPMPRHCRPSATTSRDGKEWVRSRRSCSPPISWSRPVTSSPRSSAAGPSGLSLDEMVLAVLERKIHFVQAASKEIAADAMALHEELTANA